MSYNILVLGGGGREHALVSKIVQSPLCKSCLVAPGNPGIKKIAKTINAKVDDFESIKNLVKTEEIDIVVVGPEVPLVLGITDELTASYPNLIIVGPKKEGAMLEGSKGVAKAFMQRHSIPTAAYLEITLQNLNDGIKHIDDHQGPYVLKADGLASGKGVLIIDDKDEAKKELVDMINGKFGRASEKVVIEQFLSGIEFSLFVLTDGNDYVILPEAKDYKRIGEADTGLNTGGMGAVSPVPFYQGDFKTKVIDKVVIPTVAGLKKDRIDYCGFIFFGLIMVDDEPYVIEYNCRMGDPETEAVFPRIKSDIVEAFVCMHQGALDKYSMIIDDNTAATVILVSGGYPGDFEKGLEIVGVDDIEGSIVFHSGTTIKDNALVTDGGRVLAITTLAQTKDQAVGKSLKNAEKISFKNKYFRSDIGFDL